MQEGRGLVYMPPSSKGARFQVRIFRQIPVSTCFVRLRVPSCWLINQLIQDERRVESPATFLSSAKALYLVGLWGVLDIRIKQFFYLSSFLQSSSFYYLLSKRFLGFHACSDWHNVMVVVKLKSDLWMYGLSLINGEQRPLSCHNYLTIFLTLHI